MHSHFLGPPRGDLPTAPRVEPAISHKAPPTVVTRMGVRVSREGGCLKPQHPKIALGGDRTGRTPSPPSALPAVKGLETEVPAEKWGAGGAGSTETHAPGPDPIPRSDRCYGGGRGCRGAEVPRRQGGREERADPVVTRVPGLPLPLLEGGGLGPRAPAPAPAPPRPARALRGGGQASPARRPGDWRLGAGDARKSQIRGRYVRPEIWGRAEGGVRAGTDTQTETPRRTHTRTPPPSSTLGVHNFGPPEPRGAPGGRERSGDVVWGGVKGSCRESARVRRARKREPRKGEREERVAGRASERGSEARERRVSFFFFFLAKRPGE